MFEFARSSAGGFAVTPPLLKFTCCIQLRVCGTWQRSRGPTLPAGAEDPSLNQGHTHPTLAEQCNLYRTGTVHYSPAVFLSRIKSSWRNSPAVRKSLLLTELTLINSVRIFPQEGDLLMTTVVLPD